KCREHEDPTELTFRLVKLPEISLRLWIATSQKYQPCRPRQQEKFLCACGLPRHRNTRRVVQGFSTSKHHQRYKTPLVIDSKVTLDLDGTLFRGRNTLRLW